MSDQFSNNANRKIAFVQSCWHEEIVDRCRAGFTEKSRAAGLPDDAIDFFRVPGAFEIPLKCKQLAKSGDYALVVAAGFVVDGGIYRHEFVAHAVIDALMQVQLATEVPVLSAVLTPQRFHDSAAHREFFLEHMHVKGTEAAEAARALLMEESRALARTA